MKLTNYIRDAFIRAAMDDVPKVEYSEEIRKLIHAAAVAEMPPAVASAYKKHPDWFNLAGRNIDEWSYTYLPIPAEKPFKNKIVFECIKELIVKSQRQASQRDDLRRKLKGIAYGCTTRKALAEALPEFVKYLPAETGPAIRNLPVVANVVSDFVKAGWPKGKAAA